MEYKNEGADAKTQKKTHDEGVVKHQKREREKEYDGLTLKEMRRKHGIGENIGGEEILAAYKEEYLFCQYLRKCFLPFSFFSY